MEPIIAAALRAVLCAAVLLGVAGCGPAVFACGDQVGLHPAQFGDASCQGTSPTLAATERGPPAAR